MSQQFLQQPLSQKMNQLKEIKQQKVNCDDIQQQFLLNFHFFSIINTTQYETQLIHLSDWSQFYFIEDNPRLLFSMKPSKEVLLTKMESLNFEFKIIPNESTLGTKKYFNEGEKFIEKSFGSEKQFVVLYRKKESNLYRLEEVRFHFSLWEIYYDCLSKKLTKRCQ
eukprot:gene6275-10282_t